MMSDYKQAYEVECRRTIAQLREIERLTAKDETNSRLMYEQAKALDKLLAQLNQANADIERLETALTIMFTKANGILPDGAMCRAIAKAALAALEEDDG